MRVLITRPELQARKTASKLRALGHDPVLFPLFAPEHDTDAARTALSNPHDAIALTSAEAVRCLVKLGETLDAHFDIPVFVVGRLTAEAAEQAGFRRVLTAGGNGQVLGDLIANYFRARGEQSVTLLYLAGHRRSGGLESALEGHGLSHVTVPIYDMKPVDYSLEEQQAVLVNKPVDAVFLFSRENGRRFFELDIFRHSREPLKRTLFFCLSRNIAESVPEEYKHSTLVSANPDEDELIDLL
jgi:uroporphyrinogen-III synthase